ncbi:MAG TPA: YafY family protein [Verrucomicrobiae bacterium]|nr:YafY family protein [Verrucomicrobiae bacterium]
MERGERFYRIHRLLKAGRCVPLKRFTEDLGVSRATFKRDIEYLRDRYGAPLVWDREQGGYRYDPTQPGAATFELPGFWLSSSEIHALLAMQAMLADLDAELLGPQVDPLMERLEKVLETSRYPTTQLRKRIRILHQGARKSEPAAFGVIAQAVLERRQLSIRHHNRARNEDTTRAISPQRLVHYRDNWYVDAYCHLRKDIRTFALDAVDQAQLLEDKAKEVLASELDRYLGSSYGIFSGEPKAVAVLRFSALRARWVSRERWHPDQKGRWDEQQRYILEVPYSDDRELIMDILRHGADVEVQGPPALRERVREVLKAAQRQY